MTAQIVSALPIPFAADDSVEWPSYTALLEHVAPHVHGVLVAGTTGEFPALDDDERLEMFRLAADILGAERVIAHIGHASVRQVVRLGQAAAALGITRMATLNPYYLPADGDAVLNFYRQITEALPDTGHYVYLFPERTGITVTADTFAKVMALPGIIGVKLSGSASEELLTYAALLREGQELYSGDDSTLPHVLENGGTGVVSGVSAAFPQTFAELAGALDAGETERAGLLQETVVRLVRLAGPSITRLKIAVGASVPGEWDSRMPLTGVDAELRESLGKAAASHG